MQKGMNVWWTPVEKPAHWWNSMTQKAAWVVSVNDKEGTAIIEWFDESRKPVQQCVPYSELRNRSLAG